MGDADCLSIDGYGTVNISHLQDRDGVPTSRSQRVVWSCALVPAAVLSRGRTRRLLISQRCVILEAWEQWATLKVKSDVC